MSISIIGDLPLGTLCEVHVNSANSPVNVDSNTAFEAYRATLLSNSNVDSLIGWRNNDRMMHRAWPIISHDLFAGQFVSNFREFTHGLWVCSNLKVLVLDGAGVVELLCSKCKLPSKPFTDERKICLACRICIGAECV